MALLDAVAPQSGECVLDEIATNASVPMRGGNGEMVNQAATTVVPTEDRRDHGVVDGCYEAERRIALQKPRDVLERISATQTQAFGSLPERPGLRVVFNFKHSDIDAHLPLSAQRTAAQPQPHSQTECEVDGNAEHA